MLKIQAGVEMTHVVYRGGAPALNDVLAGQIPMTFATVSQALSQYQGGLVRALGVAAAKRQSCNSRRADIQRAGLRSPGVGVVRAAGACGHAAAVDRQTQRRVAKDHGAARTSARKLVGVDLLCSSPEEAKAHIRSEIERWAPVIRKLGLKAE